MKKNLLLLCLLVLTPLVWAQTATKTEIPAHGTAIATAGTRSTAITSETTLRQYGLATPDEAKPLLVEYQAQEEQLFAQRQAAYAQMKGKSEEEQLKIWRAMIDAQRPLLAEHRALEKRLSAALKDGREKAAAAETNPTKPVDQPKL